MRVSMLRAVSEIAAVIVASYFGLVFVAVEFSPYASPFGMLAGAALAIGFVRLRGEKLSEFGFRPAGALATIFIVLALLALAVAIFIYLEPVLERAFGPVNLSVFEPIEGNLPLYLLMLAVSWIGAAVGEEIVWRGFITTRMAQVFSFSSFGWTVAILIHAVLFGAMHAYQDTVGVIEVTLYGAGLGFAYLVGRRSLVPVIIAHGLVDTAVMTDFFLGQKLAGALGAGGF